MRINETPFPSHGETEAWIDPMYKDTWRLPDLQEPPPEPDIVNPDMVCVIPLFADDYLRIQNTAALARHALYSRWTCLKYTDAVQNGVPVKFLVEDRIKDFVIPVFESNFVDVDKDVLFFHARPLAHDGEAGAWGHLGKQMIPYWDERFAGYEWVWIWDADILFIPPEHTRGEVESTLPNDMFSRVCTFNLPKRIGYIYVSIVEYKHFEEYYRIRLEREIKKTGLSIEALLAMSGVSTHMQTFTKPMCSMALYPAKHFHNHHPDWVAWMKKYGPYWGNDEIIAGFWAHKFRLDIMSLSTELRVLMNDLSYFFRCNPPGNVLHGKINTQFEKELWALLKIE